MKFVTSHVTHQLTSLSYAMTVTYDPCDCDYCHTFL